MNMSWPGLITRQELVDFCQDKALKAGQNSEEVFKCAGNYPENSPTRKTLESVYNSDLGYIKALRDVCEWAKEHLEHDV